MVIAEKLGLDNCRALPVFHAITDCDTTSAFSHKGKRSAWEAWNVYPAVTQAFLNLCNVEADVDEYNKPLQNISVCVEPISELSTAGS